jgi:hypothetical protein
MKPDQPRFRGGAAGPLGVALIAGLVLAACGGSSGGSNTTASTGSGTPASSSTGTSGTSGFAAERSKLEACLKQHGVTLPSGGGLGAGRFGGTGASGATGFRRFGGTGASGTSGFRPGGFRRFGGTGASGAHGFPGGNSQDAAAFKACGADFGGGFAGGGLGRAASGATFNVKSAADRAAVTNYVACVRKHGFDMPSPNFSGKGSVFSSSQVDRSNPKFTAASAACQSLLKFSSS